MANEVFSPLRYRNGRLELLEQTLLPREERWLPCHTPEEVADAIRRLAVRGAPAIGVAAAFGLVLAVAGGGDVATLRRLYDAARSLLLSTRPTAVNLQWALERGDEVFASALVEGAAGVPAAMLRWAERLHAADIAVNQRMGVAGATLFRSGDRVLTHCNAGALATGGFGTAVGVITQAWNDGRLGMVWVDETRPLLQGARLTAWELERLRIPYRLITDSSAGALMARGQVDRVVVGADRIAANGDVANKIGTYTVAVLAHRHGVPFYVAAPLSTIDPRTPDGAEIPIEERDPEEVRRVFGTAVSPGSAQALNLAFDVTPAELVTAIITEVGVLEPPYGDSIAAALAG